MGLAQQFGIDNQFTQFLGNNRNAISNLGLGMIGARNFSEAAKGAAQGVVAGRPIDRSDQLLAAQEKERQDKIAQAANQHNLTVEFLRDRVSPDEFAVIEANPELAAAKFGQLTGQSSGASFGKTPIFGTDAQGNPAIGQLSDAGTFQQTQLPEDFNIANKPIEVDAKTHIILLDPITREQIAVIPKENQQAAIDTATGKVLGKAGAEATLQLGGALAGAEQTLAQIDSLRKHPGLKETFGTFAGVIPQQMTGAIPGTPKADFSARLAQLQGGAFLQAFETLKGGGQITEIEGRKAEQAIFRASKATSEAEFLSALDDFEEVILRGMQRARDVAAGDFSTTGEAGLSALKNKYGLE